jgi:TRAP-type uncharacterized transport system substrate-binding protein
MTFHFKVSRVSWRDLATTLVPYVLVVIAAFAVAVHFIRPAPPGKIAMAAGRPGTIFQATAERYRTILARQGVELLIVSTEGSLDNVRRLADDNSTVDVALVQGGLAGSVKPESVMSLGSVSYSPINVFYRSKQPIERLSQLAGKTIAIGRQGSGTRAIADAFLAANGIDAKGRTKLVPLEGKDAADALVAGKVDAVFLTGDSTSGADMLTLVRTRGVRLFDFVQADAYVRRFNYLNRIEMPPGSFDLGTNDPPKALTLVATTVELLARPDLHPAISDMLIEAARQVHGRASMLQNAGEFPAPLEHEYPLSDDAKRYYKSGKGFVYQHLPFWIASLVDRTVILLLPLLVVVLPGLKLVPMIYTWRVRDRLYKRYGELIAIERAAFEHKSPEERAKLVQQLDEFESRLIRLKLPAWLSNELYVLRMHIDFVRTQLGKRPGESAPDAAAG